MTNKNDRNAERQRRWRLTPVGMVMAALRATDRKAARQLARRKFHSERRAAVVGCTSGGDRLRDVGLTRRPARILNGWYSQLNQPEVLGL